MKKKKKLIVIRALSEIPKKFKSENAERKFWETHDLSSKLWDELYDPKVEEEVNRMVKRLRMTDRRK